MVFVCGRSDGAAFEPDAVGGDVVAAFAGKEAALAADAAAVAAGFALVVVAGYVPCGTKGNLGTDAAAALFALLFDSVLRAFDIKGAADIGINASGMGLGTVQHGIALAAELQFVRLPPPVSPPERSPGLLPCPTAVSATAIRMPRRRLKTILWQCLFMVGGIRSVCGERQPENGKRGQAACDVNTQQLNPKLYSSFTSGGKPKVSVWPV